MKAYFRFSTLSNPNFAHGGEPPTEIPRTVLCVYTYTCLYTRDHAISPKVVAVSRLSSLNYSKRIFPLLSLSLCLSLSTRRAKSESARLQVRAGRKIKCSRWFFLQSCFASRQTGAPLPRLEEKLLPLPGLPPGHRRLHPRRRTICLSYPGAAGWGLIVAFSFWGEDSFEAFFCSNGWTT